MRWRGMSVASRWETDIGAIAIVSANEAYDKRLGICRRLFHFYPQSASLNACGITAHGSRIYIVGS